MGLFMGQKSRWYHGWRHCYLEKNYFGVWRVLFSLLSDNTQTARFFSANSTQRSFKRTKVCESKTSFNGFVSLRQVSGFQSTEVCKLITWWTLLELSWRQNAFFQYFGFMLADYVKKYSCTYFRDIVKGKMMDWLFTVNRLVLIIVFFYTSAQFSPVTHTLMLVPYI